MRCALCARAASRCQAKHGRASFARSLKRKGRAMRPGNSQKGAISGGASAWRERRERKKAASQNCLRSRKRTDCARQRVAVPQHGLALTHPPYSRRRFETATTLCLPQHDEVSRRHRARRALTCRPSLRQVNRRYDDMMRWERYPTFFDAPWRPTPAREKARAPREHREATQAARR